MLKLTIIYYHLQFTCDNGLCIDILDRCNRWAPLMIKFHPKYVISSKPDCFDLSDEFQCRKIEPGPSYQVFMFNPLVGDEINHLLIDFSSKSQLSLVFFIFSLTSLRPPSTAPTRSSLMSPQISCQFLTSMKYLPFFRSISEIWWNDFLTLKVFKVQFFLHLTWQDSRLKFYNLKEDTGLNALSPQAWSWNR